MTISLKTIALPISAQLARTRWYLRRPTKLRANAAYANAKCDWLAVYADREHFGNIAFLTGFEPRFEEAFLLLGPTGKRVLITGNRVRKLRFTRTSAGSGNFAQPNPQLDGTG